MGSQFQRFRGHFHHGGEPGNRKTVRHGTRAVVETIYPDSETQDRERETERANWE